MWPYITPDEVKAHLQKIGVNHDDQLQVICEAVSEYAEDRTGRYFALVEDEEREYCIGRAGEIDVVDLIAATLIEIDVDGDGSFSFEADLTKLEFLPRRQRNGRAAVRFQRIVPHRSSSERGYFLYGRDVRITGDWGYVETRTIEDVVVEDAPPARVSQAGKMLVARYYRRRESPLNVTTMPTFGFKRMFEEDKDANNLLEPLVHERLRRVVQ